MLDLVAVLGSYSLLTTAGYLTAHPELWNHINLQPTTATPLQKGPELSCPTASSGSLAPMLCPNASLCVHLQVGKQVGWEAWLGLRETLISEDQPEKFLPKPGKIRESVLVQSPACCGVRSSSREHPAPAGWTPGLWECGMHEAEVQGWRSSSLQERPVLHRSRWEYMSLAAFQTPALLFLPACSPPLQSKH